MKINNRPQRFLTSFFIALGISIFMHFFLFVVVAASGKETSALVRAAEAMLTPAEGITERIAPGHSGSQIYYGFVVSTGLYAVVLWPITAFMLLRRKQV